MPRAWRWRVAYDEGTTGENFVFCQGTTKGRHARPPLHDAKGPGGCLNADTSPARSGLITRRPRTESGPSRSRPRWPRSSGSTVGAPTSRARRRARLPPPRARDQVPRRHLRAGAEGSPPGCRSRRPSEIVPRSTAYGDHELRRRCEPGRADDQGRSRRHEPDEGLHAHGRRGLPRRGRPSGLSWSEKRSQAPRRHARPGS